MIGMFEHGKKKLVEFQDLGRSSAVATKKIFLRSNIV